MIANKKFPIYYGISVFVILFAISQGTSFGGSFAANLFSSAIFAASAGLSFWMIRKYGRSKE